MTDLPPPPPPPPPPGQWSAPPPAAGAPTGTHRIGRISRGLVTLLAIMAPLQALGVVSSFSTVRDARRFLAGEIDEDAFLEASALDGSLIAQLLVIPVAILTMIWMYRMAVNLRSLGRQEPTWSPGWAIGGWFVPPCAIYVIPWLMFTELWRGSDPAVAPYDPSWRRRPVSPIVHVWWILYGLVPLVGIITTASSLTRIGDFGDARAAAESLDQNFRITVVLSIISVVTTVVYLQLVRQLSARHMRCTGEV